jgi:hypothetical protein
VDAFGHVHGGLPQRSSNLATKRGQRRVGQNDVGDPEPGSKLLVPPVEVVSGIV